MRKILKSEREKAVKVLANAFDGYPLYNGILGENCKPRNLAAVLRLDVYSEYDFTYADNDFNIVITFKKPSDKSKSILPLFFIPRINCTFFRIDKKSIRRFLDYDKEIGEFVSRYYNPETDIYLKSVGVKKEMQGKGIFKKALDELDDKSPIYLTTYSEKNVKGYEKLGFKVLGSHEWNSVTVYSMRREQLK